MDRDVRTPAQEWATAVRAIADDTEQFASGHTQLLKETKATVEKYATEELVKDVPTGK